MLHMIHNFYTIFLRWSLFWRGIALLFTASMALANIPDSTLAWDPSTDPSVTGYRLYYGTASGSYTQQVDVGNSSTAPLPNLTPGTTYYFVVTAYDASNVESVPSNEVTFTVAVVTNPVSGTDDQITIGSLSPAVIDVLANDNGGGNTLTVTGVTVPSHGTAVVNANNTITYTPAKTFPGEDFFSYTISDGQGDTGSAQVTILNPFLLDKGSFNGLVTGSSALDPQNNGFMQLKLLSTGKFTGKVKLGSRSIALNGAFDPTGNFTTTISAPGKPVVTVTLTLDATNDRITGTVTSTPGSTSNISADLAAYSKTNPAPQAGAYTLLLPPGSDVAAAGLPPKGFGYGKVTVATSGLARVAGVLGDGTHFSAAITIARDGTLPLYASLYSGKGSISGYRLLREHHHSRQ